MRNSNLNLSKFFFLSLATKPTEIAEIVDKNDLFEQSRIGSVKHRVHGAEQNTPSLVVEDDYDRGGRQRVIPLHGSAT